MQEIEQIIELVKNKRVCIYGAGKAGSAIYAYLSKKIVINTVCDMNCEKHGCIDEKLIICSVDYAIEISDVFLVGFYDNDEEKISSACNELTSRGVPRESIFIIKCGDWIRELSCNYSELVISKYANTYKHEPTTHNVKKILFIATGFRKSKLRNSGGGPLGALIMQHRMFNNTAVSECEIDFFEYPDESDFRIRFNIYDFITENILLLSKVNDREKDILFIANDLYSAFALSLINANYVLIYHGQGDIFTEWKSKGITLSDDEHILMEKVQDGALKGAIDIYFPSSGAKLFYITSYEKEIMADTFPLYNTIFDFPKPSKISVKRKDDCVTFFSIGNITTLKGIDQIPDFLYKVSKCINKRIRWILVGDGDVQLKRELKDKMVTIDGSECCFISPRLSHAEIFGLFAVSDVYIMLHRVSIFDFSTLEAMFNCKAIVLSDIPGNREYNVENNILLVNEDICEDDISEYINNYKVKGENNYNIYQKYFSMDKCRQRYEGMIKRSINKVKLINE